MTKWDLAGVHGLNKYIWSILQSELGWSTTPYGGRIPITTPQQQPEFNAIDAPYIVYTYAVAPTGEKFIDSEIVAYTIFSAAESDVRRVVNLLVAKLKRDDDSAVEVNTFISANGSTDQKEFDYKTIAVTSAQGAQPSIQEGGRYDGLVMVRFAYTHYSPLNVASVVPSEVRVAGQSIRY